MTHTRTETESWEVDVCDECNHDVRHHYNEPVEVKHKDGSYWYTAVG
jgi:hypothetical protein